VEEGGRDAPLAPGVVAAAPAGVGRTEGAKRKEEKSEERREGEEATWR
jgi:hypothetical protein